MTNKILKDGLILTIICSLLPALAYAAEEYTSDEHTLGLWHLNEAAGTNVPDSSPNANHGTLVGATLPTWTTGVFGNGLNITAGLNSYQGEFGAIQLPNGIFNNLNNMTFEMYLNWDYRSSGPDPGETGFLGYLLHDGGTVFVRSYVDTTNPARYTCRLVFAVQTYNGWLELTTPHEYTLEADVWTHVAFTRQWDGINTTIRIYVDGEQAAETSIDSGAWYAGWSTYVGNISNNGVSWGGQVDEIRLSDVVRQYCGDWGYYQGDFDTDCYVGMDDLALIAGKWLQTGEGFQDTTDTAALYHLNQSSGTTVIDDHSSGRPAHDGTLTGPAPNWTAGYFDNGLHFDRHAGTLLEMGNLIHTSASFTLEFLFKWDYAYVSEPGYIYSNGGTTFARTYLIERGAQPAYAGITFGVRRGDGIWFEINTADQGFDASKFVHVAFVREWDGANTTARIYLDGQLAGSGVHNGGFWTDGADLALGHATVGIGGTFDEIRFTKSVLSQFIIPECGTQGYDPVDTNQDCHINLLDFSDLSHSWMQCSDPAHPDQCVDCNGRAFSQFTLDADTLALWHLNEGSGSTLNDASANNYHMTINGPYIWSAGAFDTGLTSPAFAEGEYCITNTPLPFTTSDPDVYQMSMSAWVKLGGTSGQGAYAMALDTAAFMRVDSGGSSVAVGFYSWDNFGTWYQASVEPSPGQPAWTDGLWHHVAGVYDGMPDGLGNANVSMFWDGELVDAVSFPVDPAGESLVNTGSGHLYVGTTAGDHGDPNTRFVGSIDEIRISDTVRTEYFPGACE